jgi:hypothetical protein
MIDNSLSMGQKHSLLAEALPVLMARLIEPRCLNAAGEATDAQPCPSGYAPEFEAVRDIHVGIITSSLGHHGSNDVCSDASDGRTPDDLAQLLPSVRPNADLASWNDQGFLVWDPRGDDGTLANPHVPPGWGAPGGPGDANDLIAALSEQVAHVGEFGCGFEGQLEAWYRFLIDPEPVQAMDNDLEFSIRAGANQLVLEQRAAFLRRDSLVAIVMFTDENDCSILDEDGSRGWLVPYKGGPELNTFRMPASTNSCKQDPNDPCCRPCVLPAVAGCGNDAAEGCPENGYLSLAEDSMDQRCFDQVRRFGLDLLYPTSRYVEAITSTVVDPRLTGSPNAANPLFAPGPLGEPGRERGLVLLAGIVGVPWQDIATDGNVPNGFAVENSLTDPRALVFLTADQLRVMDRWSLILGDSSADPPVAPGDPHMIESIDPRPSGAEHPLGLEDAAILAPGSSGMNAVNGREQAVDPSYRDDLQFACIFPLQDPVPCTDENAGGCSCNAEEGIQLSPLCEFPNPGMDGIQVYGKAYPSVRELEVLRGVGEAGIVASICPKNPLRLDTDPATDPYYGYTPAVTAIVARVKDVFRPNCLGHALDRFTPDDVAAGVVGPDEVGRTPCTVVEVRRRPAEGACTECGAGRQPLEGPGLEIARSVVDDLEEMGFCGGTQPIACDDYCLCEVRQFSGEELAACRAEGTLSGLNGYCYIDPQATTADAEADGVISEAEQQLIDNESAIAGRCAPSDPVTLRFLGENLPVSDGLTLIACPGASP